MLGGIDLMRENIAFGVAIVAIGYNVAPDKGSEEFRWFAAILLLVIGCIILAPAIWQGLRRVFSQSDTKA